MNDKSFPGVWVMLKGDTADLESLARNFRDGTVCAVKKDEPDQYYLKMAELSAPENDDESEWDMLRRDAGDRVAMLNGAMMVEPGSTYRPVHLGSGVHVVHNNGRVDARVFLEGVEARLSVGSVEIGGDVKFRPEILPAAAAIRLAQDHRELADALMFLGREPGWMGLYKVFEEIMKGAGDGKIPVGTAVDKCLENAARNLCVEKTELERFRKTANKKYRHNDPSKAPKNPMSLDEANQFIWDLLRRYIDWLEKKNKT